MYPQFLCSLKWQATSLGQEPTHLCVDFLLLSQQLEREMGISLGSEWPAGAHHRISRHDSHDQWHSQEPQQGSAIPSQLLRSQQRNTCILPSSRTKTTWAVIPCHFTGKLNAAKSQQRDTSQASSLDWSSTLVYVVKLKEINTNYAHKWPWKNVISVIYHQRHKQHRVLAEQ